MSGSEARGLLLSHGPNDLRSTRRFAWLKRLFDVLSEPTLLILVLVLAFYVAMGSKGEAALLSLFVLLVIAITYVEEARTEGALRALASMSSPRALALRDGAWTRISGLELVPGDLVRLAEGDRVAADGELLEAHDLRVDESMLTGESLGVWKLVEPPLPRPSATPALEGGRPSREEVSVYAGTLVLAGQGVARVTATGPRTRAGLLSRSLAEVEPEPSPFQRSTAALVRVLAGVAAVACLAVVGLASLRGASLAEAALQGLTLAIATVPEELPVVLAVFLAMGARRLARKGVLVSHVPAVEALGSLSLLAVDKTGTLTRNEMRLAVVLPAPGEDEDALLTAAALASEPGPSDPMERRIVERAGEAAGEIVKEYALGGRPPRMGHAWSGGRLAAKGATEGVLEHCADPGRDWALSESRRLAGQGLRVLAVARAAYEGAPPSGLPSGMRLSGLLAFEDPLREGVRESMDLARRAGLRVVMMTGDSAETAAEVARQAGFRRWESVVLGSQLELEPGRVDEWARSADVFARLAPEQKLILIRAWTAQGETVGMSGDGVNDAPALASAHVGVAMGRRGTDVAREAADLVLVDDSFEALLEGIRSGRETGRRIRKAGLFILAVHVPIVAAVLGCLALGLPPLIGAAQIAFLELFIGPACSVVFEKAADGHDVLSDPPRPPREPLLQGRPALLAGLQGAVIAAAVLALYQRTLASGASAELARSEAFLTLLFSDFLLCFTLLSPLPLWRRDRWTNWTFYAVTVCVLGLLALLLRLPQTASVFHMAWPDATQALRCLGWAAAAVLWAEWPSFRKVPAAKCGP